MQKCHDRHRPQVNGHGKNLSSVWMKKSTKIVELKCLQNKVQIVWHEIEDRNKYNGDVHSNSN